ncbi:MAG: PLP-dependent aminotransferase family protein, partial [Clostridium sp.]
MDIKIDRLKELPIIRQIYNGFRDKILRDELKYGDRMPSTRELSSLIKVSRNVVLEAYSLLESEGYIYTVPQSGTFVSNGAVFNSEALIINKNIIADNKLAKPKSQYIDLRSGIPALDLFPIKKWNKYHSDITLNSEPSILGYGQGEGELELRNEICHYLLRMRGLNISPEQLIITSGSLHTFSMITDMLSRKEPNRKYYIIEDPLHNEIKKVLSYSGTPYTIPVDNLGMQTSLLPENLNPSYIFVTPSHQYPLGSILPIQRRIELIKYARLNKSYIIEDDYDSEYRYDGTAVSTLFSLDPNQVIYIGTFSKVLFPSIRIGYVILPQELLEETKEYIRYHDYFTNTIDQLTLAKMLQNHVIEHHIYKMKKLYKIRHDFMIKTINEVFKDEAEIYGTATGLHFVVKFKNIYFTEECIEK